MGGVCSIKIWCECLFRVSVLQYAMVELYLLNTVLEKLQAAVDKGETGIFFMFSGAEI